MGVVAYRREKNETAKFFNRVILTQFNPLLKQAISCYRIKAAAV
jgi:hypothetical protein